VNTLFSYNDIVLPRITELLFFIIRFVIIIVDAVVFIIRVMFVCNCVTFLVVKDDVPFDKGPINMFELQGALQPHPHCHAGVRRGRRSMLEDSERSYVFALLISCFHFIT